MKNKLVCIMVLLMVLVLPRSAHASGSAGASASATIDRLTGLTCTAGLEFGSIAAGSAPGSVTIHAGTGARSATGGAIAVASSFHPAHFVATGGRRDDEYRVRFPDNSITISNGSGAQMRVESFTSSVGVDQWVSLDSNHYGVFDVGGTLNVAANQAPGEYTGTFRVRVSYD